MNQNSPSSAAAEKDVSIILPTYNEAGNILTLVDRIEAAVPEGWRYRIVVVDDSSPDGTYDIVRKRAEQDPNVKAILRTEDRGFAKSIRHGIEQADSPRIIVMDSDLTHDPLEIPRLLHVVDKVVRSPSGKPDYRWAKKQVTE